MGIEAEEGEWNLFLGRDLRLVKCMIRSSGVLLFLDREVYRTWVKSIYSGTASYKCLKCQTSSTPSNSSKPTNTYQCPTLSASNTFPPSQKTNSPSTPPSNTTNSPSPPPPPSRKKKEAAPAKRPSASKCIASASGRAKFVEKTAAAKDASTTKTTRNAGRRSKRAYWASLPLGSREKAATAGRASAKRSTVNALTLGYNVVLSAVVLTVQTGTVNLTFRPSKCKSNSLRVSFRLCSESVIYLIHFASHWWPLA